jgi:hypothetical protein
MREEKKRVLEVELDGEALERFLDIKKGDIKKGVGLTDDIEVVRLIVDEYFKEKIEHTVRRS